MVYGRLHELSLSKLRINYILVASFFKPLLSFVPKAIFIIYTATFFLFVRFGKSSSIQLRASHLFVVNRGLKTSCIRRKKTTSTRIQDSHNTAKRKYWPSQLCVYVRWRLHVDVCSIRSNCSCRLFVCFVSYAKLRCFNIDNGMVCDLCKGSFVCYVKYDLIIHLNQ